MIKSVNSLMGAALLTAGAAFAAERKPNVIYVLCDDLGYGEVGYNGQVKIQTPELDALAGKGMRFTSHYCGNSVCAPSRCSLVTGKHPGHAYIRANSPGYPDGQTPIPADSETIGKVMQRAGYKTACIGKWGLGSFHDSGNPNKQGFGHFFGYTDQRKAHEYYPEYLWRNGEKVMLNGKSYSHDLFTDEAFEFVEANRDQPFFLYLAYTIPHTKYQVPEIAEYVDPAWPENMQIHASMTSRLDRDVGRLVRLLEELGIADDTLLLFNSDNGAHGMQGSLEFFNTSGTFKGKKRDMYEGGVRSPMFAYWPGKVAPGTVNDHLSAFWDMLPTFSELAGEPLRGETDGISMLPTLLGNQEKQKQHKALYWELYEWGKPNQAVRMGKWKGVVSNRRKGQKIELYDVSQDEGEQHNVASEYPEVVERIRKALNEAHEPSPFWSVKEGFNPQAACDATGAVYVPPKKKKPKKKKWKKRNEA